MATSNCNDAILRQLLSADDDLGTEHVNSCPRCQSRLLELAGSADDWTEAKQLLSTDETDAALTAEARHRAWSDAVHSTAAHGAKPTAWTESMARQLLGPPSHPEMLGRLGRYEVERLIGSGGMGIVFKGFDTELNRPVAIKILAPHLAGSGAARQRFSREARAAAAVVHEHVVAIHNVESDAAAPFLVMQYVAGESLQTRLDRRGPLAVREILRIAHQTAAGLAAAHAQGLVHRDVKPSNIMLEEGVERALLTDFGLARAADDASLTHTGYLPGTPHYMSPEQARGDSLDARSDLFSLGSVMYAMCTGRPPFRADTSFGVLRRITDTPARPIRETNADVPAWLVGLIEKLLAKQPADRIGSAAEVAILLEQCLAHVQQPEAVPLPEICRVGPARASERRPTTLIAAALATLVIIASTAAYLATNRTSREGHAPRTAEPLPTATSDPSPLSLEWDAATSELVSVERDMSDLKQRVEQFWTPPPTTSLPAQSSPESMP
jgi:eukaryotic-like serine/threonine-protein kinase